MPYVIHLEDKHLLFKLQGQHKPQINCFKQTNNINVGPARLFWSSYEFVSASEIEVMLNYVIYGES